MLTLTRAAGADQAHAEPVPQEGLPPGAVAERPGWVRWLARALIAAGIGMVPWLAVLAVTLPGSTVAAHWSTAWAGLDAMEAAGLLATGALLLRRDDRCCLTAAVTAALVFTDAWFDTTTAAPGAAQLMAILMAACIEVPASAFCAALAVRLLPRR